MLESCLDHIKLKKNAGALEDKGHHIEGKNKLQALMRGAGMKNSRIKLKNLYSTWLLTIKKTTGFDHKGFPLQREVL